MRLPWVVPGGCTSLPRHDTILGMNKISLLEHERVDDIPFLIGLMTDIRLPDITNRAIPRHGNHQGLDHGSMAVAWLAYILSEGDHRKVSVEPWVGSCGFLHIFEEGDMTQYRKRPFLGYSEGKKQISSSSRRTGHDQNTPPARTCTAPSCGFHERACCANAQNRPFSCTVHSEMAIGSGALCTRRAKDRFMQQARNRPGSCWRTSSRAGSFALAVAF